MKKHEDVGSQEEIPRPTYLVTYRGEVIFAESRARDALARVPENGRWWRVLCKLDGATRTVWSWTRREAAAA